MGNNFLPDVGRITGKRLKLKLHVQSQRFFCSSKNLKFCSQYRLAATRGRVLISRSKPCARVFSFDENIASSTNSIPSKNFKFQIIHKTT